MKLNNTLLFVTITLLTGSSFAQKLTPGTWKAKAKINLNGIPLPSNVQEECVRTSDTKNLKKVVSEALGKNGCTLKQWKVKKQTLDAKIKCKSNDLDAEGGVTGTIGEKKYELKGSAEGLYKSHLPAKAEFLLNGEWLGPCEDKKN